MSELLVSVIVLTYNHDAFVKKCLESILSQTTDFDFEILVADDVSRDKTVAISKEMARKYPRIKFHQNIKNDGPPMNFKKALGRSTGQFIAFCDGDDYWSDNNKLQMQADLLKKNAQTTLVYADYGKVDSHGEIISTHTLGEGHEALSLDDLIERSGPSTNSIMLRRTVFPKNFPKQFFEVPNPDVFIIAWALQAGNSVYIPFVLSTYRVHDGGVWSSKTSEEQRLIYFSTRMAVFSSFGWKYVKEMETCRERFKTVLARVRHNGDKQLYRKYLQKLPLDERAAFGILGWYYRNIVAGRE